jgi:hydrogenase 3 maturation protease
MPSWNELIPSGARVAIVGVGQELRGDDAAGLLVIRRLRRLVAPSERILLIEAGIAPENVTGKLRRLRPDVIILIDAARMGEPPGTIRLYDWWEADGVGGSTHTLPLSYVCRYLIEETGSALALIGIQAGAAEFDQAPSEAVKAAAAQTADELAKRLRRSQEYVEGRTEEGERA